jgi:hypothetical protein
VAFREIFSLPRMGSTSRHPLSLSVIVRNTKTR